MWDRVVRPISGEVSIKANQVGPRGSVHTQMRLKVDANIEATESALRAPTKKASSIIITVCVNAITVVIVSRRAASGLPPCRTNGIGVGSVGTPIAS